MRCKNVRGAAATRHESERPTCNSCDSDRRWGDPLPAAGSGLGRHTPAGWTPSLPVGLQALHDLSILRAQLSGARIGALQASDSRPRGLFSWALE